MGVRRVGTVVAAFIVLAFCLPNLKAQTQTIRGHAPQPAAKAKRAAPAVLLIEGAPGGARVYLDNKPMGKTNSNGRLKLSTVSPGEHRVRLTHRKFQEYEERLELSSGKITRLDTKLVAAATTPAETPSRSSARMTKAGATASSTPAPPTSQIVYIPVMHDHGSTVNSHCVGFMAIGNGWIQFKGTSRKHIFRFPLSQVSEAKKNEEYLSDLGAFHIKLANGTNYDFVALTAYGQFEPPDTILAAIEGAKAGHPLLVATTSITPAAPIPRIVHIQVMHDHGSAGNGHCVGLMTIGDGMIQFKSKSSRHAFHFSLSEVSEAKRNEVYLADRGAFHIKFANGAEYNFVALNDRGEFQPPDTILAAIDRGMGKSDPGVALKSPKP